MCRQESVYHLNDTCVILSHSHGLILQTFTTCVLRPVVSFPGLDCVDVSPMCHLFDCCHHGRTPDVNNESMSMTGHSSGRSK